MDRSTQYTITQALLNNDLPNTVNYKITEAAKDDLRSIYKYGFTKFGEAQADLYYDELFKHFEKIAENPYLYQAVDHIRKGYRRSVCGTDSIFYRVVDDYVEIISILSRQDFGSLL